MVNASAFLNCFLVETGSLTEPRVCCFWVASLLYLPLRVGTTNTLRCAWLWLYMGAEDETHACTANIILAKPFLQPPTIGFLIVLIPENLHHTLYILYFTVLGSSVTCHKPESYFLVLSSSSFSYLIFHSYKVLIIVIFYFKFIYRSGYSACRTYPMATQSNLAHLTPWLQIPAFLSCSVS